MMFKRFTSISDKVEKYTQVKCQCKCGKIVWCRASNLIGGKSVACIKCRVGKLSNHWKGIGQVPAIFYLRQKSMALARNIPFSITLEYMADLFEKQSGKCALSDLDLHFEIKNKVRRTASLDRIDSSKGYVEGNVQWVHCHINSMKNAYTTEYFIHLCNLVSKHDKI